MEDQLQETDSEAELSASVPIEIKDPPPVAKRKRIVTQSPPAFTANMCTKNARPVGKLELPFAIDLHFDKHYLDKTGEREGISEGAIKSLVHDSMACVIMHASCTGILFANHNLNPNINKPTRVVCQKEVDGTMLNAAIEVHHLDHMIFEVTVVTAMWIDGFDVYDGQYVIELTGGNSSKVSRMIRGSLKEIYSI